MFKGIITLFGASMMQINTGFFSPDKGVYSAWGYMRDITGIALIIVVLLIIISQLTGYGIENYGIKKMLPRLIVAILAINLSFLICQVSVDVSNIAGHGLNGFFTQVADDVGESTGLNGVNVSEFVNSIFKLKDEASINMDTASKLEQMLWSAAVIGIVAGSIFPLFILSLIILLFASKVFSNEYVKFSGWKQAETAHFTFIYESASELAAKEYAKIADEAWDKIAQIYSMPQEKTNVYVLGRQNIVNAYTYFAPPCIVMYNSPIIEETFGFRDDWMKLFFTHELIHIANITFEDKSYSGAKIFGEFFRNMDYAALSGWAMEGLTTVLETELTNGGRGRSPYFELQFKAPTLDNSFIPYRLIGSEKEMPTGQIYVMGYLLMRTIADRWGIQALADIERNRSYCATWEEAVYTVTGKTAEDLYREVKIALEQLLKEK